ncbi:MAG: glycosyltransferase family 9 protein [Rhodospirillaceae bacterium]
MRDYCGYRCHLAFKRAGIAALRTAVRIRLTARPAAPVKVPSGTVVLLDRCLGIGDALMISPALRLLEPLGPVTVVTALPPVLDWTGEWRRCADWAGMVAAVNELAADGRLLLVPKLGVRGLITLLRWPGAVPAGVVRLDETRWLDAAGGRSGTIAAGHYTEGALACAWALLNRSGAETPPRLPPLVAARLPTELPDGPLVALAPRATSRIRIWPLPYWRALVLRLAEARPELRFVLLGSAEERVFGDEIGTEPPIYNLMGRLSLAETAAVIARSAVLVACDNGLMHIGLGTDTPLVAVFGSTPPMARLCGSNWRLAYDPALCPRGLAPCYPDLHRDPSCPTEIECLTGLSPERVAGLALELLDQGTAQS